MNGESISLNPNVIAHVLNIPINSAMLGTFFVTIIILLVAFAIKSNISLIPSRFQYSLEFIVNFFYSKSKDSVLNKDHAEKLTYLVFSLFIFIFFANQFSLIPLVQNIVVNGGNLFKTPTAHLSQTLSLSLAVVILSNIVALYISPLKHIDNLLNLSSFKIKSVKELPNVFLGLFLGVLNIIGEFSKVISLACRLFGNVFAGEVMVLIIVSLSVYTSFIVPIPFILISTFSGLIQAMVFSFLALSFISNNLNAVVEN